MEMPENLLRKSGVYQIINTANGKIYIGSSVDLYRRYYIHYGNLCKNKHENKRLQNSWNKHGEECFEFYIVEFLPRDKNILRNREQFWIDKINPFYNIVREVRSPLSTKDTPRSKEHRQNHSIAMKNSKIVQSDEYKKSQSDKVKALWKTPEYRNKQMEYYSSEETKKQFSENTKRAWENPSFLEKFRNTLMKNFSSGEKYTNKKSKVVIDAELVKEVRRMKSTGNYTNQDLAKLFSIGHSTVSRMVNRVSWGWIE